MTWKLDFLFMYWIAMPIIRLCPWSKYRTSPLFRSPLYHQRLCLLNLPGTISSICATQSNSFSLLKAFVLFSCSSYREYLKLRMQNSADLDFQSFKFGIVVYTHSYSYSTNHSKTKPLENLELNTVGAWIQLGLEYSWDLNSEHIGILIILKLDGFKCFASLK